MNVTTAMWTYFGKIMPLVLLLIWFFTCKHWWYHSILIPISMYLYQMVTAVYQDLYLEEINFVIDSNQLIYLAPFFIGVLFILYIVRIKIFDRIYGIDLSELNETDISVFTKSMSTNEEKELEFFRQQNPAFANEPTEDYYRKL